MGDEWTAGPVAGGPAPSQAVDPPPLATAALPHTAPSLSAGALTVIPPRPPRLPSPPASLETTFLAISQTSQLKPQQLMEVDG